MAGVFARLLRIDEAKSLVSQLRRENRSYESRLSSWIMYVEGLIAHFESLDTTRARDWFHRARAIAVATGDRELCAICAAWLSDSEFRIGNIASSLGHLETSLMESESDNHEALGRAYIALADLACWSGMIDFGRAWYGLAREHAVKAGDIGLQSAILFNSVSFRVQEAVTADCFGTTDRRSIEGLLREVLSVSNLDAGLGMSSLTTMVPALIAELKVALGDWTGAIESFDGFLGRLHHDGQTRLSAKFLAQRAWCNTNMGDQARALSDAEQALERVDECPDLDDLAVIHVRLCRVNERLEQHRIAAEQCAMATRCREAFVDMQSALRTSVTDAIARVALTKEDPAKWPGLVTGSSL
jgi:tetratricopeptide (TPR) repeat protein